MPCCPSSTDRCLMSVPSGIRLRVSLGGPSAVRSHRMSCGLSLDDSVRQFVLFDSPRELRRHSKLSFVDNLNDVDVPTLHFQSQSHTGCPNYPLQSPHPRSLVAEISFTCSYPVFIRRKCGSEWKTHIFCERQSLKAQQNTGLRVLESETVESMT
jgi:hypothetical protein